MTQFVAVKFSANDKRVYTYRNDGEPVAIGDKVDILSRTGTKMSVEVVSTTDEEPSYACKPILGPTMPAAEDADDVPGAA